MDLELLRKEIDAVDNQIIELFSKRMDIAAGIAQYKKENGKAVFDPARERAIVKRITEGLDEEASSWFSMLYNTIFEFREV